MLKAIRSPEVLSVDPDEIAALLEVVRGGKRQMGMIYRESPADRPRKKRLRHSRAKAALSVGLACVVVSLTNCGERRKPPCVYDGHWRLKAEPCEVTAETVRQEKELIELQRKLAVEKLRQLHGDPSKAMREFRWPDGTSSAQPKTEKSR